MNCTRCGGCCVQVYQDNTIERCPYLEGRLGETSCTIEIVKPDGCRRFEPGSECCLMAKDEIRRFMN